MGSLPALAPALRSCLAGEWGGREGGEGEREGGGRERGGERERGRERKSGRECSTTTYTAGVRVPTSTLQL